MRSACIIPARHASVRFPAKALASETGKPLIQHVYENVARAACFEQVIVATDDPRIVAAVESFGGTARMTREDHPSGTDRIAEVARDLDVDIVVNVQGDEPQIQPELLETLVNLLATRGEAQMATLAAPCRDMAEVLSPNVVKVVFDTDGRALYFSRSAIPFDRAAFLASEAIPYHNYHKHIGVYAYRREALMALTQLPQTPLEKAESLEQLRALENGWTILVGVVDYDGRGIDTPEDYEAFVAAYRRQHGPA
jgi:3-deoxy-manno-octulosonate cytidylyltransferase (CMP-KDO synthetase)